MSRSNITAIRPLIYVTEKDIKKFYKTFWFISHAKSLPYGWKFYKRRYEKFIYSLSNKLPYIRSNMLGAIERNYINGWKAPNKNNSKIDKNKELN